jgi:ribosomal 50S subunit-associated protein YjgA (DUF615 family)
MNRTTLPVASLFIAASLLTAQFEPEPKYDAAAVSALVDRVHEDLDHAYGVFHFSNADRDRLNHAEKDLREFSQKWEHGKFDKGQLNGAIESVQHVLCNNKLPAEQRDALSGDITQLRRMREAYERHEIK